MKYILCPPGPEPKRYTASCPKMVEMLMGGNDLTIDERRLQVVPASLKEPIEDALQRITRGSKE